MEKNVNKILEDMEARLKAAEQVLIKFEEQAEKRLEARNREKELEARILEAKLKWRPKDWFILSGIIAALISFLGIFVVILILAFSYVPPTTTTISDVQHNSTITADNGASNDNVANFIVK